MYIGLHVNCPFVLSDLKKKNFNFLGRFSKNKQVSNFMQIRPVEAELFHAKGRTDSHDRVNSRFPQFCVQVYTQSNSKPKELYVFM